MTQRTASGMAALRQAEETATKSNQEAQAQPQSDELVILDKSLLEGGEKSDQEAPESVQEAQQQPGEYQPPVTQELQPQESPVVPGAVEAAKEAPAQPSQEAAGFDTTPQVVAKGEMVAPSGSAASGVMLERIAKHMRHLKGERGFANNKERWEEQASFIECVGRSTTLTYSDFVVITEELLKQIRENLKLFTSGDCFRFMHDLTAKYPENNHIKYPKESAQRYQAYIGFLVTIARNFKNRQRLRTSVDPTFATQDMPFAAKQNVIKYFNQLTAQ